MPLTYCSIGRLSELFEKSALLGAAAELIATFIFVFVGEGSSISFVEVSGSSTSTPVGLLIAAVAHGFAIYAAITIAFHVSGGHVNPAVTAGLVVGGYTTVVRAVLYIVAQLIGAVLASYLLVVVTTTTALPVHALGSGISEWEGLLLEGVLTAILLYSIYATCVDKASKSSASSAPLTVGLLVTAIILAGGPFSSASMNPARSFGPAFVAWDFTDHWVYWVGPILGGVVGAAIYLLLNPLAACCATTHQPLSSQED